MINNIVNDKDNSIKLHKELMDITNKINTVKNRSHKTMTTILNNLKSLSKAKSTINYFDSSYQCHKINHNNKINNINMHINNNPIYKGKSLTKSKSNQISMISLKKTNQQNINNKNGIKLNYNPKNINKIQYFNRNNNKISLNKYKEMNKTRNNSSSFYYIDENIKDNLTFNDKFLNHNNFSLNYYNLYDKTIKDKIFFENLDKNIDIINKKKINYTNKNSQIRYIKYKREENTKNNNNNIKEKKHKIILRNSSTGKNKYSNTYNRSKFFKDKKEYELSDILNLLKAININECVEKINKLLVYKNFIHQMKNIYLENNNLKNEKEIKIKDILFWSCANKNNKNKYEEFCKEIMSENNINDFDNFKEIIKKLMKNKSQNNNLIKGINRIFDGFNKTLKKNKTIYRNLSQRNFRNNLINKNEDDINQS